MNLCRYTTKNMYYTNLSGRPHMACLLNAVRAIFGPPGIFKWEGLLQQLMFWPNKNFFLQNSGMLNAL